MQMVLFCILNPFPLRFVDGPNFSRLFYEGHQGIYVCFGAEFFISKFNFQF